jgi:hypothetical protein
MLKSRNCELHSYADNLFSVQGSKLPISLPFDFVVVN